MTQCVLLLYVTNVATILEDKQTTVDLNDIDVGRRHWAVHIVRDTDVACTPCVVVMRSGHLVEFDTKVNADLLAASESTDTDKLLADNFLHVKDKRGRKILQLQYSRTVHHGTRREEMQQVLDKHKCDLIPVHDDAPQPCSVLEDSDAVLGILLARQQTIPRSPLACDNKRPQPSSPKTTQTRLTTRVRGKGSGCVTAHKT